MIKPAIMRVRVRRFKGVGVKIIRVIGATFCQVASVKHNVQLSLAITEGSQKWQGGNPALTISAIVKVRGIK